MINMCGVIQVLPCLVHEPVLPIPQQGEIPLDLKRAIITPIYTGGSRNLPKNYRQTSANTISIKTNSINTNYNLQRCPPIARLNFDLTQFFKVKCGPKYDPHPSNTRHTVQYVHGTELVRCSNNRQHRGSLFGARKVFVDQSCVGTGHMQTCVSCTPDLISRHNTVAPRQDECQQEN